MKVVWILIALLVVAIMGSAIGVIYSKHQTRKIFVNLQKLHKQIDELDVEWGQLQLEQSAWSSHGRIEKVARKKLQMTLPRANEILYIKQ
ncbi:MAG: cell division protein FtsL [endosymbiont of Galathealinum brachiosum]|uniref:Cell division protein FtsL n=1 Tax=endosymbiont of Galathealinum brachiosum TaxID=2200906 RepID=A0A370D8U7_9GAMM|nr:MAG: cell division protein FtsL [endosymbiont of Galathealinum brachiosum]